MNDENEIVLVDDDGDEHHFWLNRIIEIEEGLYALLEPTESDDELIILRVDGDIKDGKLVELDDDEWDRVTQTIDELGILAEDDDI